MKFITSSSPFANARVVDEAISSSSRTSSLERVRENFNSFGFADARVVDEVIASSSRTSSLERVRKNFNSFGFADARVNKEPKVLTPGKYHFQQSHPDVEPVFSLSKISCSFIPVYFRSDLLNVR